MNFKAMVAFALALPACASSHPQSTTTVSSAVTARTQGHLDEAAGVIRSMRASVPEDVLAATRCLVVFPTMISGGLIVGAEHGRGYASCRTATGWSAPVPMSMTRGTAGAQIGVESVDLLMLVMTEEGKHALLDSKLELSGDLSAAAGPVGTGRGESWNRRASVLSYSHARGLYAGVDLGGAVVHVDLDGMATLYGPSASVPSVLDGQVAVTPPTRPLVDAVQSTFR